ncbi:MAG: hypothetical protein RBT49_18740, partial [Bacteroidales bacterium]|nr:hypothetical protein [Bacteroidales bacterium]
MKKFMIFFLMAFLLLSNSHSYAEKLNIDRVEANNAEPDFIIYPVSSQFLCAWAGNPTQTIPFYSIAAGVAASYEYHYWYVNNVQEGYSEGWSADVGSTFTFSTLGRAPGTYIVRQEIITGLGVHYYSNEVTVEVLSEPSISIAGSTSGCVGEAVTLTAVIADVNALYSLQWYRNGTPTGVTTQTYTYNLPALNLPSSPQNDQITVGISYAGCTEKLSPVHYVLNMPVPVVSIASPWSHCDGDYVTVTADATTTGGIQPTRWVWYGDISGSGTPATAYTTSNSINIYGTGSFTVSAQFENSACNTGTTAFTVNALTPTTLTISSSTPDVCQGDQFILTSNYSGGTAPTNATYTWYRNGVEIPGQNLNSIMENITNSGTYIYTVKATYPQGCVTALATSVNVNVHPTPDITITGTPMYCAVSATPTLEVLGADANSAFAWSLDGSATISNLNPYTSVALPAREYPYIFSVRVISPTSGCVSTEQFAVVVNPTPTIQITVDNNTPCENGTVTFTPIMGYSTDYNYQWYEGTNSVSTSYIYNTSYDTDGTYDITLTVTSTSLPTCSATSNVIAINVVDPIDVTLAPTDAIPGNIICEGGQFTLTATDVPNAQYAWYKNGVLIEGAHFNTL